MSVNIYQFNKKEYLELYNFTKAFSTKVAKYLNVNYLDLRWYDYKKYCEDVLNIEFCTYAFQTQLNKIIAGTTYFNNNKILICCNSNIETPERRNFTNCHEIGHAIRHVNTNTKRPFMDFINTTSNTIEEREADLIGSFMLLSDEQIVKEFTSPYTTIKYINQEYQISYKAITVRLKQFLKYHYNFTEKIIDYIVDEFIHNKPIIYFLVNYFNEYKNYCLKNEVSIGFFNNFCEKNNEFRLVSCQNFILNLGQAFKIKYS